MTLAETIYRHSLVLPEPVAREALDFIEFLEQRYNLVTPNPVPPPLADRQKSALASIEEVRIPLGGKPMTDREEANARC